MSRLYSLMGMILSVASVVKLLSLGNEFGISVPLKIILEYYQKMIEFFLGWADEPVK